MTSGLRKVEAVELRSRSTAVTNNATFYIVAMGTDGTRFDVVVKPKLSQCAFFKEWLGAELARELGVLVPESRSRLRLPKSQAWAASLARQRYLERKSSLASVHLVALSTVN